MTDVNSWEKMFSPLSFIRREQRGATSSQPAGGGGSLFLRLFSVISPEHWPQVARKSDNALALSPALSSKRAKNMRKVVVWSQSRVALLAPDAARAEKCTLT